MSLLLSLCLRLETTSSALAAELLGSSWSPLSPGPPSCHPPVWATLCVSHSYSQEQRS